jgi:NADP-dependent 3-hydroxy acid dehydrogenase YdfG
VARRGDRLNALARRLRTYGVSVHVVVMDVADVDAVLALPEQLPPRFAAVDILVNNAGLALGTAGVDAIELKDVQAMMDVNVVGLHSC